MRNVDFGARRATHEQKRSDPVRPFRSHYHNTEEKTMRYMMFIKHTEDYRHEEVPQSLYAAMG